MSGASAVGGTSAVGANAAGASAAGASAAGNGRPSEHGFLNVIGAAVLASACGLSEGRIRECLEDDNAAHFRFEVGAFAWNGERADIAQITRARRELILGFGSCSVDEPFDGLRGLGFLS